MAGPAQPMVWFTLVEVMPMLCALVLMLVMPYVSLISRVRPLSECCIISFSVVLNVSVPLMVTGSGHELPAEFHK